VELEGDSNWMEWPLDVEDGDMAVFLQRFSDHKLDFKFGGGEARGKRLLDEYGYISKNIGAQYPCIAKYYRADMKTDDDVLEPPLKVRFLTDIAEDPISSPSISSTSQYISRETVDVADVDLEVEAEGQAHGFNASGGKAACVLSNQPGELIDCSQCIQDSLRNVLSQSQRGDHVRDRDLLESLYKKVNLAGPNGVIAEVVKVRPLRLGCFLPESLPRNYCWTAALLLTSSGRVLFPYFSGLATAVPDSSLRPIFRTIPSKPSQYPKRARRGIMVLHSSPYFPGVGWIFVEISLTTPGSAF
jgi:hypothetical protein